MACVVMVTVVSCDQIKADGRVRLEVYDADLHSADDLIGVCRLDLEAMQMLGQRRTQDLLDTERNRSGKITISCE